MVLFSYSRIYRDQRLSARITRGIFVASYIGILKSKQDACSGVHSACREENRHKVGIYIQLFRQETRKVAI